MLSIPLSHVRNVPSPKTKSTTKTIRNNRMIHMKKAHHPLLPHRVPKMSPNRSKRRKKNDINEQQLNRTTPHSGVEEEKHQSQDTTISKELIDLLCVCPITRQLMADPHLAPDLHAYEKDALEIAVQRGLPRLPNGMERWPLGHELPPQRYVPMPAPWIISAIELAIQRKVLSDEEANEWQRKRRVVKEEKIAEAGSGDATYEIGNCYYHGPPRFPDYPMNKEKARLWYQKAHDNNSVKGTAALGACHLLGEGGPRDTVTGFALLGAAAAQGSDFACFKLAVALTDVPLAQMPPNRNVAIFYLEQIMKEKCTILHLEESNKEWAEEMLGELSELP